jgi:hypothetical protein
MKMIVWFIAVLIVLQFFFAGGCTGSQPRTVVRESPFYRFPGVTLHDSKDAVDCNSPAVWIDSKFYLFNSYGQPARGVGANLFEITAMSKTPMKGQIDSQELNDLYIWIESVWIDHRGVLYGWYHYEPDGVCKPKEHLPTSPRIGALRSHDNGATWEHLGVVLSAPPDSDRCDTSSPWDVGGHGDFSVIPDPEEKYLYFFFSSYVKKPAEQGVAVARMRMEDRDKPKGKVQKWHKNGWNEPGLGGRLTPIWPSIRDWHQPDANLFWGPSIHWNSHLNTFVILMNHAVTSGMQGDGTWISFNKDLSRPQSWCRPIQILTADQIREVTKGSTKENARNYGWYPQIIGTQPGESDKLAGKTARLFVAGVSNREIVFLKPGERE